MVDKEVSEEEQKERLWDHSRPDEATAFVDKFAGTDVQPAAGSLSDRIRLFREQGVPDKTVAYVRDRLNQETERPGR